MQEGCFWTMKGPTRAAFQPLHQLPEYIAKVFQERKNNAERRRYAEKVQWNEQQVLRNLESAGCTALVDNAREYLSPVGYKFVLDDLALASVGYEVTPINHIAAVDLLETRIRHRRERTATATQFLCLLQAVKDRRDTKYFKVKSRRGSATADDIVVVSDTGSFACSHPEFAQMGKPSRHILAVHVHQYCAVNVLLHYHPRYHRLISNPTARTTRALRIASLTWEDKLRLTAFTDVQRDAFEVTPVTRMTSWGWAVKAAASRWQEVGLGGELMADETRHPPLHAIRTSEEAAKSKKSKILREVGNAYSTAELEELMNQAPQSQAAKKRRSSGVYQSASGDLICQPSKAPQRKQKRKDSSGGKKPSKRAYG